MLRSRTNPLFCLKKEQSNIERERDSGRCSISEIKTIIIIHHQTKTVFNHLTKPSTFQLTPFSKIKTCVGLLYCLSLAGYFASEKISGFFWLLAFIQTYIYVRIWFCFSLFNALPVEILQSLDFTFFVPSLVILLYYSQFASSSLLSFLLNI